MHKDSARSQVLFSNKDKAKGKDFSFRFFVSDMTRHYCYYYYCEIFTKLFLFPFPCDTTVVASTTFHPLSLLRHF